MENWTCSECGRAISVVKLHYPVYCTCGIRHLRDGTKQPVVKISSTNRIYSEDEIQKKLRRSREEFAGLQQRRAEGNRAWRVLHCRDPEGEHDEQSELKWLQHEWEPLIPRFGCSCYDFYSEYKAAHQPSFKTPEERFRWGFHLHNAVNDKLSVPLWTYEQAFAHWRPHRYWNYDQPKIQGVTAVTSLSPLDAHRETQKECLASWKRFGLRIISGNLASEIPSLQKQYPDVQFLPVEASKLFDRPTPRIRDLMRLESGGILLLNSDIAIYGSQDWILDAIDTRTAIAGVRQNWIAHPGDAEKEQWGIDAFLLFPEQIDTFPNLDLAIGQPVWDYWLAYHLQERRIDVKCLNDRLFFHRRHVLNWKSEMTSPGLKELESYYGKNDWNKWRVAFGEGRRELHQGRKLCSIRPVTVKPT